MDMPDSFYILLQWSRVPNVDLKAHALKLSDIRGWSLLCEDSISMIALHIPEEDRCIDIFELIEHEKLLRFELVLNFVFKCFICKRVTFKSAN